MGLYDSAMIAVGNRSAAGAHRSELGGHYPVRADPNAKILYRGGEDINRTASISFTPDDGRRGEATYCNPVPGCKHKPFGEGYTFADWNVRKLREDFPPGWD